jgi:2,4-dienoyl-CoA reductase-like NADH-dependent reductase (Old Yellow Enzyme family)
VPLILVGEVRSPDVAERLVAEGTADYIAVSRPLICEPDLVNRWKNGDPMKSACVNSTSGLTILPCGCGKRRDEDGFLQPFSD